MKGFWKIYQEEFWSTPNWFFVACLAFLTWNSVSSLEPYHVEDMSFLQAAGTGVVFAVLASLMAVIIIAFACLPSAAYKALNHNRQEEEE